MSSAHATHTPHTYLLESAHVERADDDVALDDDVGGVKGQSGLEAISCSLPPRQEHIEVATERRRQGKEAVTRIESWTYYYWTGHTRISRTLLFCAPRLMVGWAMLHV